MRKLVKFLGRVLMVIMILLVALAIYLRIEYGGGKEYGNVATPPVYNQAQLEEVIAFDEPIGNVAVSKDTSETTRVFLVFTQKAGQKEIN